MTGQLFVGGLVGWNDSGATASADSTSAAVSGSTDVGGLVGVNFGYVTGDAVGGGSVHGTAN